MKGFRVNKEKYLLQQLEPNSNLLHVGCTNSPATIKRWENKILLHQKLCDTAKENHSHVTGIDIDKTAIDFLRSKMPDETILHIDAHHLPESSIKNEKFDLIIAGDVIEHLPNPGMFLQSCHHVLSPGGRIIITTANAFGIVRFLKALIFHEAVHSEHTAYYSHKTLGRLLRMCNLDVSNFGYYQSEPVMEFSLNRLVGNFIEHLICVFFPHFSEGVVVTGKKANG